MNQKVIDACTDAFETVVVAMISTIGQDVKAVGVDEAFTRFQGRVERHAAEHGTWIDAPESERVAAMCWAAAELLVGAFINAGVWHE